MDAIMHIVLVDAAKHLGQKIWQVVNVRCECLLCVDEECRVALDTAIRLQLVEQQSGVQQQKHLALQLLTKESNNENKTCFLS